ncbi:MAG: helix-turn-helix domain-containing protein [Proteobacteria bacterium]|nr:helix-turn-helix domain-containing protein [Pseudomonadota bacterium]
MSSLLSTVGQRVRAQRGARGWSQKVLCERAGMSPRFLVQLESGQANVSLTRLSEVAEALEVSLVSLVAGLGPESDAPDRVARAVRGMPAALQDRVVARVSGSDEKVALIGLRGAGKSSIGAAAAQALGIEFVVLDRAVEAASGLSLAMLFEIHGPEGYRVRARAVLREVLRRPGRAVVEIGGSLVMDEASADLLWSEARVVWLSATPAAHLERVAKQGDTRPMAGHQDARAEITALLTAREVVHKRAHHHVDTMLGLNPSVEAVIQAARALFDPTALSTESA